MEAQFFNPDTITISRIEQTPEFLERKNFFIENMKRLVFRRIDAIENIGKLVVIIYQTPFERFDFYSEERYKNFCRERNMDYENQYTVFYYDHFEIVTSIVLRGNDPTFEFANHTILGNTENYGELTDCMIVEPNNLGAYPLPKKGQLVCGYTYNSLFETDFGLVPVVNHHVFELWFLASEQLFHAFSSMMSEEIQIFHDEENQMFYESEIVSEEARVKKVTGKIQNSLWEQYNDLRKLFSGNKLCTNGCRKWELGCYDNEVTPMFGNEIVKKYNNLYTESLSINFVHFYAFLVLVFKFGAIPDQQTIPKNLEKDYPNMLHWDIPEFTKQFAQMLIAGETHVCKNYLKI